MTKISKIIRKKNSTYLVLDEAGHSCTFSFVFIYYKTALETCQPSEYTGYYGDVHSSTVGSTCIKHHIFTGIGTSSFTCSIHTNTGKPL